MMKSDFHNSNKNIPNNFLVFLNVGQSELDLFQSIILVVSL